jgi:hypothetical protein
MWPLKKLRIQTKTKGRRKLFNKFSHNQNPETIQTNGAVLTGFINNIFG